MTIADTTDSYDIGQLIRSIVLTSPVSKIFLNYTALTKDYRLDKLLYRDPYIRKIGKCFKNLLNQNPAIQEFRSLVMTGSAGTGKTELVRLCVQEISALAKKRAMHIMSVYLDCAADQTVTMKLARIIKLFYHYNV